jgi:hypothetical protein
VSLLGGDVCLACSRLTTQQVHSRTTRIFCGMPSMPNLQDHVLMHVPRCLSAVRTTKAPLIEDRGAEAAVAFHLLSPSGDQTGEIHGFDLRDYNPDYSGPCEFIGPLVIKWPNGQSNLIFDSDSHGYHGELQSSAKLRGDGEPRPFLCSNCDAKTFQATVQFDYCDACNDLWEDEPETKIEDFFSNIIVAGKCGECGHLSRVLDMDL